MTRYLFLDFDGVLNRNGYYIHTDDGLEPHLVQRVRRLVQATDAQVVLSTDWRKHFSKEKLRDLLHTHGLRREWIVGTTPVLKTRGMEIATWLADLHEPVRFAVVDDNDDGRFEMNPVRAHFVQTDPWQGFTPQTHARVQQLLTAGPVWRPGLVREVA